MASSSDDANDALHLVSPVVVAAWAREFAETADAPATLAEINDMLESVKVKTNDNSNDECLDRRYQVACPEFLQMLWGESREWHAVTDHYDVFGLNIFPPNRLEELSLGIFGDLEMKSEWEQEHPKPNVACPGWLCFASFSEFDYLFVYVVKHSTSGGSNTCSSKEEEGIPLFGSIRRCVNNCFQDEPVNVSHFLDAIPKYLAARKEATAANATNNDTDETSVDEPEFGPFLRSGA